MVPEYVIYISTADPRTLTFLTNPIYAVTTGPGAEIRDSLQEMFVEWINDWINIFPIKPYSQGPQKMSFRKIKIKNITSTYF